MYSELVDASNLDLEVVRKSDGKKWRFNKDTADGYFTVNNDGYGDGGCIIFLPTDFSANAGDSYTVTARFYERKEKLTYKVNFFSLSVRRRIVPDTDDILK